ncbi:ArsS family sensor histidine kinase [Hydrogenimonas cancrithermarum]|uniref:histidine kinase n=1 Tax=Hydrogenimonas cancrithermarum TaxID=2993563 RepID=A0ABM8FLT8_9BACT|nr:ArsS family sensor histidine kinase [Hydrogenimonas cancrithermarum]BDY13336.1 two-component sensor histidine kinase [Hydrogenimonas cancrithermarum]
MNRHSIFFKLNLIFLFSLATLIAFFVMMVREIQTQELRLLEKKVVTSESEIRKIIIHDGKNLEESFRSKGYRPIEDPSAIRAKLKPIFQHPPASFPETLQERIHDGRLKIYRDGNHLYFELIGPTHSRMISTPIDAYRPKWIALFFGSMIGVVLLLYWTMRRSLIPLKTLATQIRRFGEGDMTISTRSDKKDEIAYVANQFDAAVKKIKAMKEARTLFMRNIMHELKTPITKGKLSVALIEEGVEAEILRRAFSRMEELIQEMAQIELITSQSLELKMQKCDLETIVENVATLLFVEPERIKLSCHPCSIVADCDLITIVLKNLIDNAFKYGTDKRVDLCYRKDVLEVINKGAPLAQSFERMIEPFAKGSPSGSKESFGLGLYIVKSILDAHGAELSHRYEKGRHHFVITGLKPAR